MARLTQTEIVNQLAETSGLKKSDVKGLFDALAQLATREVQQNGEFTAGCVVSIDGWCLLSAGAQQWSGHGSGLQIIRCSFFNWHL